MIKSNSRIFDRIWIHGVAVVQFALLFLAAVTVRPAAARRMVEALQGADGHVCDVERVSNNVSPQSTRVWNGSFICACVKRERSITNVEEERV
jgi:hypothetical protein